jgi:hypothetical protein
MIAGTAEVDKQISTTVPSAVKARATAPFPAIAAAEEAEVEEAETAAVYVNVDVDVEEDCEARFVPPPHPSMMILVRLVAQPGKKGLRTEGKGKVVKTSDKVSSAPSRSVFDP